MIGRLVIAGVDIDIVQAGQDGATPFPFTFSIADIKNPDKRSRSRSKSIPIPGTRNNMDFFSSTYQLSLTNVDEGESIGFKFDPTLRVPAQYYEDNDRIFDGLAQLLSVDIDGKNYTFNICLLSNYTQLLEALGQRKLAELGWTEYNHTLNNANIKNSWDTSVVKNGSPVSNFTGGVPDGFGYLYPLGDYGFETNLRDHKNNNLFPHVYYKEVMEKCFAVANQTIDSDFMDTELFKRKVIGFGGGVKQSIPVSEVTQRRCRYTGTGTYSTEIRHSSYTPVYVAGTGPAYKYIYGLNQNLILADNFWSTTTVVVDALSQLDETTGGITIARTGPGTIRFLGEPSFTITTNGSIISSSGNFKLEVALKKNGSEISTFSLNTLSAGSSIPIDQTINVSLVAGDIIEVVFKIFSSPMIVIYSTDLPSNAPYYDFQMTGVGNFEIDLQSTAGSVIDGDTVYVANYLPDITCADFVKGVIMEFNLYISEPDGDNVVKIEPLEDYYNPTNVFDDWTHKQDLSKKITILPSSTIEGKIYAFKFDQDDDYYNKRYRETYGIGYGDYNYQVQSTFQINERVYKLPWAQTVVVQVPGSNIILPTIISVDPITGVVSPFKGKARTYYYQGLKSSDSWVLRNSATPTTFETLTSYPVCSHLDSYTSPTFDHNWGLLQAVYFTPSFTIYPLDNLFSEYHYKFIREITGKDSKILKEYFYLKSEDVHIEKFRTLAMINGVLFRKNIINDYSGNGYMTTSCELIRVIEADSRRASQGKVPVDVSNVFISSGEKDTIDTGTQVSTGEVDSVSKSSIVVYG